jgi:hypothetical protein
VNPKINAGEPPVSPTINDETIAGSKIVPNLHRLPAEILVTSRQRLLVRAGLIKAQLLDPPPADGKPNYSRGSQTAFRLRGTVEDSGPPTCPAVSAWPTIALGSANELEATFFSKKRELWVGDRAAPYVEIVSTDSNLSVVRLFLNPASSSNLYNCNACACENINKVCCIDQKGEGRFADAYTLILGEHFQAQVLGNDIGPGSPPDHGLAYDPVNNLICYQQGGPSPKVVAVDAVGESVNWVATSPWASSGIGIEYNADTGLFVAALNSGTSPYVSIDATVAGGIYTNSALTLGPMSAIYYIRNRRGNPIEHDSDRRVKQVGKASLQLVHWRTLDSVSGSVPRGRGGRIHDGPAHFGE